MRLFIGIPLPESYHDKAEKLARLLDRKLASRIKWTPRGNAHITLAFLGHVDKEALPRVKTLLSTVGYPSFSLRAGGCGYFPNAKKPRVLWTGIMKGARACADLAASVTAAITPIGFAPEEQPFTSHITLGRIKENRNDDWESALLLCRGVWPSFTVDRFTLWQSELSEEGASYTALEEFPLGPPEAPVSRPTAPRTAVR
ncbi:RNA 2',3'-cyclic phosphodiesterase [Pseudodesulfovibrio cashew]|nr:RNA 2',3'-cyclic phosphodiesterase [Pseudodesulfovibrio cashew]